MADKIPFEFVSPERMLLAGEADMITLPGAEGYFAVLRGHEPLIATLKPGVIEVAGGPAGEARYFVSSGFVEVAPDKAVILAEEALPMSAVTAEMVDQRIANAREDVLQAKSDAARERAVGALNALEQMRAHM